MRNFLIKSRSDYDSEDYENMLDDCDDEADSVVRKIRDAEKNIALSVVSVTKFC